MHRFDSFSLPKSLVDRLTAVSFTEATPIQQATIPLGMSGKDILGTSQTGSGKTAAFIIPLVVHLMKHKGDRALVLAPTRELALQIVTFVQRVLPREAGISCVTLIGGQPMGRQIERLRRVPALVVGTPGRMCDHLDRGTLKVDDVRFLVLDEADCMLGIGFSKELNKIAKALPKRRQTLMFSATMEEAVLGLAKTYLSNPERVEIGSTTSVTRSVAQRAVFTTPEDKYGELLKGLGEHEGGVLVFAKTRRGTEKLCQRLRGDGENSIFLHGGLSQGRRKGTLRDFKEGKGRVLVATDVAARGIDIGGIGCVVNYDFPQCPEDYIHRVGRTGRGGASGAALLLVTSGDYASLDLMRRRLDLHIEGLEDRPYVDGKKGGRQARGRGGRRFRRGSSRRSSGRSFKKSA